MVSFFKARLTFQRASLDSAQFCEKDVTNFMLNGQVSSRRTVYEAELIKTFRIFDNFISFKCLVKRQNSETIIHC